MDAHGIDTVDLRASVPAVRDSGSRSVSRAASPEFIRETTELGAVLDASALVLQIDSGNEKQVGRTAKRMDSGVEGLAVQGDKYPDTQKAPCGGQGTRSMKPQAGNRSRFRPWGYI